MPSILFFGISPVRKTPKLLMGLSGVDAELTTTTTDDEKVKVKPSVKCATGF